MNGYHMSFLLFFSLLVVPLSGALTAPSPPHNFYGSVSTSSGATVQSGTVSAVYNSTVTAETSFTDGTYRLQVDDPGGSGADIRFYVNGRDTNQSATWQAGHSDRVDLTVPVASTDDEDDTGTGSDTGSGGDSGSSGSTSSDSSGGGGSVRAPNQQPVAGFTVQTDGPIRPNTTVTLNASQSFDPDGSVESYEWSTGETGQGVEAMFNTAGTYNVTLIVTDGRGDLATVSKQVGVEKNTPPSVYFDVFRNGVVNEGENVTVDASASYDTDGSIVSYDWSTGETGERDFLHLSGNDPRDVTLTVTDNEGATNTLTRTVTPQDTETAGTGQDTNTPTGRIPAASSGLLALVVLGVVLVGVQVGGIYDIVGHIKTAIDR